MSAVIPKFLNQNTLQNPSQQASLKTCTVRIDNKYDEISQIPILLDLFSHIEVLFWNSKDWTTLIVEFNFPDNNSKPTKHEMALTLILKLWELAEISNYRNLRNYSFYWNFYQTGQGSICDFKKMMEAIISWVTDMQYFSLCCLPWLF